MLYMEDLYNVTTNAEEIELYINNNLHPVRCFGGEIPDYFDGFIVNDIYASEGTLVICIEDEDEDEEKDEDEPAEQQKDIPDYLPFE